MPFSPEDLTSIQRHLSSDDPASVLLHAHLWVEELLTDLIRAGLEMPDEWKELARLGFEPKVRLARAQGGLAWPGAIYELNRLRNQVAHRPRFELDRTAALQLARSFEPDFGELDEPGDYGSPPSVGPEDTPAEIVAASAVSLIKYLMVSIKEVMSLRIRSMEEGNERLEALLRRHASDAEQAPRR